jgi:endonuclease YncB( thermonuclease family)
MKRRSIALTVVMCFLAALSFAENPNMGTWKLNETKSKIMPGMIKNTTVVYAADGDKIKVTTDGTGTDGKPMQTEWTGKFDGKDYPLTGDSSADTRSYKQVNDHTLTLENKKGGKVTTGGKIVVSADGKTRTLTTWGTNAEGKKLTSSSVYDKQ